MDELPRRLGGAEGPSERDVRRLACLLAQIMARPQPPLPQTREVCPKHSFETSRVVNCRRCSGKYRIPLMALSRTLEKRSKASRVPPAMVAPTGFEPVFQLRPRFRDI
jgi:hypothetical protein